MPLDGGRITAALHPALWLAGFVGLLGLVIWKPNPILIIILIFSAIRALASLEDARPSGDAGVLPRQAAPATDRRVLYFGLAALLVLGMHATHVPRNF